MIQEMLKESEERMNKSIDAFKKELNTLRAGRANPSLLERVTVEYYGAATPLNQLANITVPDARLIIIQPWDKSVTPDIERAIMKSDLGLSPSSDGTVIRLVIPQLTEERRKELVKVVKKKTEEAKVVVRNNRRDANDEVKLYEKEGELSEDEARKAQEKIQELTDKYIKKIDEIMSNKEAEIMEV